MAHKGADRLRFMAGEPYLWRDSLSEEIALPFWRFSYPAITGTCDRGG